MWANRKANPRLREIDYKSDKGSGFDEDGDLISDDWSMNKKIRKHNDGDQREITNSRQEGASKYWTTRLVFHPGPANHPEDNLSMLEPYYSNLYRNVWLRFRNYTKYLHDSRGYRDLEWNYPFENFQGPLRWWLVTGTWGFLGPFAEKWDMRTGMTENGQGMPEWAWDACLTAHGHEVEQDWETMAQVYKSCKELMDLTRAYLGPTPAKQAAGLDVFPEVLSVSLKPKDAPYPRFAVPLPKAPAYPKLVELAAIRPPQERKRTIAGNAGALLRRPLFLRVHLR